MRKIIFYFLIATFISFSFQSCNQYKSLASATKVSQLSGNPFYFNLSKSLIKNIGSYMSEKGIKGTSGKVNLLTPLSSIFTSNDQIEGFKKMLTTVYHVYPQRMDSKFAAIKSVKDLVAFVAANGRNFNFYSSK